MKLIRLFLLFLLVSLILSPMGFAESPQNFQDFLNQWRTQNHITSVVIGIEDLKSNQIQTYQSGGLLVNTSQAPTMNSLYGVGSISKTFVSATLLQLQEEGKINLDKPIGPYFPEYPRWKLITIRQLLNMSAGIYNFTESSEFEKLERSNPKTIIPPKNLIDMAYAHPNYFAPGRGWHYSNTNYFLAALIIEKITHESLAQNYQERFFKPLNLSHSFYSESFYPKVVLTQMAHAYANHQDITDFNAGLPGAAGAMLMSTGDLLTWTEDLFTPGKVLDQKSLNEFLTTVGVPNMSPRPEGSQYGLGVFWTKFKDKNSGPSWWYTGVITGYTSIFMFIPAEHKIITAQVATYPDNNYAVLFPNQDLVKKLLELPSHNVKQEI